MIAHWLGTFLNTAIGMNGNLTIIDYTNIILLRDATLMKQKFTVVSYI